MPTPFTTTGAAYIALSTMITPALFMTATGSMIISTSNRMSRIVDRIRTLNEQADRLDRRLTDLDYPDERAAFFNEELRHLEWRSDRVRFALTFLYMSLSAFVGTSLTLGADVLLGGPIVALPTGLAVLGVGLLLAGSVNLTREAHRALGSNRQEIRFHRDLRARRQADRAISLSTSSSAQRGIETVGQGGETP